MNREDIMFHLQEFFFSETYLKGSSCDLYGDVEGTRACLNVFLDKRFPMREGRAKRTDRSGELLLVEIHLKKEWSAICDVKQRYWTIWQLILRSMYEALSPKEQTDNIKKCSEMFLKSIVEVASSNKSELAMNMFLNELDLQKIRPMLIFYNYDAIAEIFPKEKEDGGYFFNKMFELTVKCSESNRARIILVSEQPSSVYAHHMKKGSSFISAYPEIQLEEDSEETEDADL